MFPAAQGIHLDVEAISGIMGSISIACWLVVFSPQIIENFRRSSTEGLSIFFVIIWLTGDVFNVLGAVLQGVLPTMIILAVYYAFADTVLLSQCFYYRGFSFSDKPTLTSPDPSSSSSSSEQPPKPHLTPNGTLTTPHTSEEVPPSETSPLLHPHSNPHTDSDRSPTLQRRPSALSETSISAVHLSPATPLLGASSAEAPAARNLAPQSPLQTALFNALAILLVCAAGVFGWWLSTVHHSRQVSSDFPQGDLDKGRSDRSRADERDLDFDTWGQVFGYLCASFYLGSRVPQLLLNFRRKSTEGVSMLFFLFACVGNLTYVLSIFAYEPACVRSAMTMAEGLTTGSIGAVMERGRGRGDMCGEGEWAAQYGKYILVNLSWLFGSAGTFLLDLGVFVQFWMYRGNAPVAQGEGR